MVLFAFGILVLYSCFAVHTDFSFLMSSLDWFILIGTLLTIVGYGVWKTRGSKDLSSFLKGNNDAKWWGIGISIMATQASAITFLSTPGSNTLNKVRQDISPIVTIILYYFVCIKMKFALYLSVFI